MSNKWNCTTNKCIKYNTSVTQKKTELQKNVIQGKSITMGVQHRQIVAQRQFNRDQLHYNRSSKGTDDTICSSSWIESSRVKVLSLHLGLYLTLPLVVLPDQCRVSACTHLHIHTHTHTPYTHAHTHTHTPHTHTHTCTFTCIATARIGYGSPYRGWASRGQQDWLHHW